jgi:hypothetical protein
LSETNQSDLISFKLALDAHGHKQQGARPWLVVSVNAYNDAAKLAMVCPITSHQGSATICKPGRGDAASAMRRKRRGVDLPAANHRLSGTAGESDRESAGGHAAGGAEEFEDVFGGVSQPRRLPPSKCGE